MAWRWAAASVIGTSHIRSGDGLQDAWAVTDLGDNCILAVVSDGAGSAEFGAYGARLTCRFLTFRFREQMRKKLGLPTGGLLDDWVRELRNQITKIADRFESTPRQFASTLAAILVSPDEMLTLQVGDSAVVGRNNGEWEALCWPENGEYASSTYFVTDDPQPRLNVDRPSRAYDAFALFSDGVGDLALLSLERAAHSGFFDPMMRPVDAASDQGRLAELSKKLGAFLASPKVCERTDDDKTLILISRR